MAGRTPQTRENHPRTDPPFHYFLIPAAMIHFVYAVRMAVQNPGFDAAWGVVIAVALIVLTFLFRTYSLRVQDRVIRLEETLRMGELLPEPLRGRIGELSVKQMVALRFASDGELAALVQQTLDDKLEPKAIKEKIRNWRPDYLRV